MALTPNKQKYVTANYNRMTDFEMAKNLNANPDDVKKFMHEHRFKLVRTREEKIKKANKDKRDVKKPGMFYAEDYKHSMT